MTMKCSVKMLSVLLVCGLLSLFTSPGIAKAEQSVKAKAAKTEAKKPPAVSSKTSPEKTKSKAAPVKPLTLFNGKDLSGWKGRAEKNEWRAVGKVSLNEKDKKAFSIQPGEGVLVNGDKGNTTDLLSTVEYGDCQLHIEFCIPEKSNSGVYLQGLYEIQIFDSFGKAQEDYTDCGSIYARWANEKAFEGHPPKVNASKPAGEWQSFDAVFQAPRFNEKGEKIQNAKFIKVLHNGKLVQENVEVTGSTRAALDKPEAPKGPLMLQGDHGPVAYRNITIVPLDKNPVVKVISNNVEAINGEPQKVIKPEAKTEVKETRTPDVIYVPTPPNVVEKMLELAEVKKDDLVYDLGCGDGRIVVTAALKYGCKGVGYDIDPERIKESLENVEKNKVGDLVKIEQKDIFTLDLSQADVITLYLLPSLNVRLIPQLEKLKPGSRIVSHDFDMKGVKPDKVVQVASDQNGSGEHTIYFWTTPLKKETAAE